MNSFLCGVDLGQSSDPTAIVILEKRATNERPVYNARHIERVTLGMSYPAVVRHVKQLCTSSALLGQVTLVIDHTGVGRPVFDAFDDARLGCPLYGITITGGDTVQQDGSRYRVPKRDLIGITRVLLDSERLNFAPSLRDAPVLVKELLNFKLKIDPATAHDSYSAWREGIHDDLVLALAMACWFGEHHCEIDLW